MDSEHAVGGMDGDAVDRVTGGCEKHVRGIPLGAFDSAVEVTTGQIWAARHHEVPGKPTESKDDLIPVLGIDLFNAMSREAFGEIQGHSPERMIGRVHMLSTI